MWQSLKKICAILCLLSTSVLHCELAIAQVAICRCFDQENNTHSHCDEMLQDTQADKSELYPLCECIQADGAMVQQAQLEKPLSFYLTLQQISEYLRHHTPYIFYPQIEYFDLDPPPPRA